MTHIREGIFTMSCFQVFTTEERVTQEKIPGEFFSSRILHGWVPIFQICNILFGFQSHCIIVVDMSSHISDCDPG